MRLPCGKVLDYFIGYPSCNLCKDGHIMLLQVLGIPCACFRGFHLDAMIPQFIKAAVYLWDGCERDFDFRGNSDYLSSKEKAENAH